MHVRIMQKLEQLREQDALISKYVLESRYGLLRNYDPLVTTQLRIEQTLDDLASLKPDIFGSGYGAMQLATKDYRQILMLKFGVVESFKSHNAVLANSRSYFPLAIRTMQETVARGSQEERMLQNLLQNVLLFDQDATETVRARVKINVAELRQSRLKNTADIGSLLHHVEIILEHKDEVDKLIRAISLAGTTAKADVIFKLYGDDFARRERMASYYKLAMALLSLLILTYVAWLMRHLQQARATLSDSLRELEFQKHALDVHAIVSITDQYGKILYTNEKFTQVSQYKREELLGQDHRVLNSGYHSKEFFQQMWATISVGKIWQGEVRNRRKDGTYYWVDSTIAPFMDEQGKPRRYVSIRTDISARKESEISLLHAKEEAEKARVAAEQANKIKGDFLANMSHEIRTPMNGIIGMTNLALDTDLTPDQHEFLKLIQSSANSLLQIINDILDFSKIESGMMSVERIEFSLEYMLGETMKSLATRAHQKSLELLLHVASDVPDRVYGDPGRLRQVIVNLVGNAIKFTESGEVEVSVICADEIKDSSVKLRFSVRDTGIGIPEDKFGTIFESFSQADTSTTRKYGGTGLGLTISSQLVQLMGGYFELESTVGQGSTFSFTLDMPIVTPYAISHYQQTGSIAGMSVLVADDNATNRMLLEKILLNWKMRPTLVPDGEHALIELQQAAIAGRPFDITLLDVQMPGMDGFDLAGRINQITQPGTTVVMMLTSQGQRGDASRFKDMGVSGYLVKPVSQSELLDAIMTALGKPKHLSNSLITRHALGEARVKMHLLLAEDNEVNQILATRILEKLGHTVCIAHNGRDAVQQWQDGNFDAVLMDVDMPEMNGYEATAMIRQQEHYSGTHIPIIAMTAHAMEGARGECLAHGMDGYLSKPIDIEALWLELDAIAHPLGDTTNQHNRDVEAETLQVINFTAVRKKLDDNRELFDEIVGQYLRDAPLHLQHIQESLVNSDAQAIRRSAHALQGMVGIFFADKAMRAARSVEQSAGEVWCDKAVAELELAMQELKGAIEEYKWQ